MNPRTLTPSLSLLLAFEASARHESYTKAAAELSLTQSAVSRQVQVLEGLVQVPLFARRGRAIALTEPGRLYMQEVGLAIARIRNATLQLMASPAGAGSLNLAVLPTFGAKWLMPRLHDFHAAHPKVLLHVHARIGPLDLALSGMDAVICVSDGPPQGLVSHLLLREELVVVASPALIRKAKLRSVADLSHVLLLRVSSRPNAWSDWFSAVGEAPGERCFGPSFELTSHLLQAAQTSIGAGVVPRCLVEEELASKALAMPFQRSLAASKAYYLAYPAHKRDYMPLATFRDWLLAGERI